MDSITEDNYTKPKELRNSEDTQHDGVWLGNFEDQTQGLDKESSYSEIYCCKSMDRRSGGTGREGLGVQKREVLDRHQQFLLELLQGVTDRVRPTDILFLEGL